MNAFLKNLDITFRRDPTNYRPRINKHESTKDREQKLAGTYYVRLLIGSFHLLLVCVDREASLRLCIWA
jgi:hypothetical protein